MKMTHALGAFGLALACIPGVAAAQSSDSPAGNFDGVRAEVRIGYEKPNVSGDEGVITTRGSASFGGEVGYDFAVGNSVVVGPYAVYEFSSSRLCDTDECIKQRGNFGVGGRLGFVVGDATLLYAKVGYARVGFRDEFDSDVVAHNGGVQGAIGVNYNFTKNAYVLAEANYGNYDFGDGRLHRLNFSTGIGVRF